MALEVEILFQDRHDHIKKFNLQKFYYVNYYN
jgi:hypothetical protein